MTLTIKPTAAVVTLAGGMPARIWEGATDAGVPVALIVAFVGCEATSTLPELVEVPPPSIRTIEMFSLVKQGSI